jgi:oligosaccharide repeat unit polymerase
MQGDTLYDITQEGDIITENDSTGMEVILKYLLVDPVTILISPVVAAIIMKPDEKNKVLLFILNVAIVVLHTFQHGGRDMLIVFIVSYVFAFLIYKNKKEIKTRVKLSLLVSGIAMVMFSLWVSASRGIDDMNESLYYYFSGGIPHLQTCIDMLEFEDMTLGLGVLYGILFPILIGIRGVGLISSLPSFVTQAGNNFIIPQQINKIGESLTINAHVGISYYFYAEGGMFFVLLGCMILGYGCMRAYINAKEKHTLKHMAVYNFVMCLVIMSFIRFQLILPGYAFALLYISTFVFKRKNKV